MYFVVLGAGQVGFNVAQVLSNEGHEVVLIEKEKERVARIYNKIDCQVIIDEGSRRDVLLAADIERAEYFIASSDSDEINLLTCVLVRQLAPHVINVVRLRNTEYIKNTQELQKAFPVDFVVHPEREAALSIIRSIEYGGGTSDVFTFKEFGEIMMRNFFVDKDSSLVNKKLKDINQILDIPNELKNKFLIALINRKEEVIIPTGENEFQEGDEFFIIGDREILEILFSHLGKTVQAAKNIKKIFIIGASPIAEQIVDCYSNTKSSKLASIIGKRRFANREITVIEEDIKLCESFLEKYENITVLHADITEEDVLEDLDIASADMVITTTDSQERNLVFAAHSHNLGVKHTIGLVRTPVYFNIAAELGIGMSISIRGSVISSILGFLRGGELLYNLGDGSYGIFECKISPNSRVAYKPINSVTLPAKSLVLCLQGEQSDENNKPQAQIAYGNTILEPNAKLLCVAHPDSIDKLQNLFFPDKENTNTEKE